MATITFLVSGRGRVTSRTHFIDGGFRLMIGSAFVCVCVRNIALLLEQTEALFFHTFSITFCHAQELRVVGDG
jgi:hypothetical protein